MPVVARMTRARALRAAAGGVAYGTLTACGAATQSGSPQAGATAVAPTPSTRPTSLLLSNDWTSPDRRAIIEAWVARANRIYPHIKTELRDNAAGVLSIALPSLARS